MTAPSSSPSFPSTRAVSSSTATSCSVTTISAALTARGAENPPSAYATYAPYITMTARFTGSPPSFYNILSLSSAAIRTHTGLFARFFHAPQVDLRLPHFLSPELRRLAFVAASDAFSCDFCKASAFSFGDMFRGSLPSQVRRGHGDQAQTPIHPGDAHLTPEQRAVLAYARAAVERPLAHGLALLGAEVQRLVGPRGFEVVNAVVAFSGASNTLMDVLGVTLGSEVQSFALQHLPADGESWTVDDHHKNVCDFEACEPWVGEEPSLMGLRGNADNFISLLAALPSACKGMKYEMLEYEGIPYRTTKLYTWVDERLGQENCAWFRAIQGTELKRAFCFGLRENVLVEDNTERCWSPASRFCFLYLFARVTGSVPLAEMAVELYPTAATDTSGNFDQPRRQLSRFARCANADLLPEVAVGRHLVFASAVRMGNVSDELVEKLVNTCAPEAIVELASLISFFELWRRMIALFTPHSAKLRASRLSLEAPLVAPPVKETSQSLKSFMCAVEPSVIGSSQDLF